MSLIHTAERNHVAPFEYLVTQSLLTRPPGIPWNHKPQNPHLRTRQKPRNLRPCSSPLSGTSQWRH